MPFIIREHPTHLTPINGVAFAVHEAGSISDEVGDELAELFLSVPLFRLAEEDELPEGIKPTPVKESTLPRETAAQKKVREKAEKEAAAKLEAQQKADAEAEEQRLAQEKADADAEEARLAEEKAAEEAANTEAAEKAAAGDKTQSADNVF